MQIFSNFNVYNRQYTYDEMKVMNVLSRCSDVDILNYEDIMRICEAVYAHWIDGRDESEDEKYKKYPWLEFENTQEDGYIQEYAQRVLPEFIKLYIGGIKMKRVKQISLDIVVGSDTDGEELAEEVMNELERRGFRVLGAGFQCDLTDDYNVIE